MPKSRSRSRKGARPSPEALRRLTRSRMHRRLGVLTVLVVLAAAVGWFWWQSRADEAAFAVLAEAGKAALGRVDSPPGRGGGHLTPGQSVRYGDRFPTSGIHDPEWVTPGFYTEAQSLTRLVHALEHGNVVVSYDRPGDAAIATLRMWTRLFGFEWGGRHRGAGARPRRGRRAHRLGQAAAPRDVRCPGGGGLRRRLPRAGAGKTDPLTHPGAAQYSYMTSQSDGSLPHRCPPMPES